MNRDEALSVVKSKLTNKNLVKHSLAVEAVMRALAAHFHEDEEVWGIAGLLHDLDYEATVDDWTKHGILTEEWLVDKGIDKEIFEVIKAHNSEALGIERKTRAEKAIYAADPITGLIIAATLMVPSKRIGELSEHSVLKRFKSSGFARGANRDQINTCEDLGLSLEEFISISLKAMQGIADELGF